MGCLLSMRAAHARLSNGCAGIRVCCAPIRADYYVVSPHKYRRMRRLYASISWHSYRTPRAKGPMGPDTLSAGWPRGFASRRPSLLPNGISIIQPGGPA